MGRKAQAYGSDQVVSNTVAEFDLGIAIVVLTTRLLA
jgi:hypothetical protein